MSGWKHQKSNEARRRTAGGQNIICMIFLIVALSNVSPVFSQKEGGQKNEEEEVEQLKGTHRVTTGLGHTHLAKGVNVEGKTVWLPVPSWSFNYDYWIANKWAIGLQSDFVLEKYVVENENGEDMEREKPLALIPVVLFKPFRHFSFVGGAGVEYEANENMGLTRLGVEFGTELPKGWEAGIAAVWDCKWGNYNSWVLEFSFSKNFFRRKK